ncbi:hypothetical protein E2320_012452 [Naja naja]|nr:hypothetical protein E2320_012452 [Naja naja]
MWDDVELLTSDDTGSGQLSIQSRQECGSALYQMNTLVKITSSKKVLSNPELNAYNLSDGCVLVADRTVVVLDNICQSLQMFIHFETEVDIVGLCQEGQFLVAGERSGSLHLIQVSSKQTALVQSPFDEKVFLDLILEMDSSVEGTYHAFILTSKGFFCIMHLPLANIQKAITEMDVNAAKKLQSQVETCFISVEDYHTAGCFTSVTKGTANTFVLIIGGIGSCAMSVWEVNPDKKMVSIQNVGDSSLIQAAKKLQVLENLLFDVLSLWDLHSLTLTWDCPAVPIEEFLLTSESDFSAGGGLGNANLKLVALTTPDHIEQMKSIVVFSLPAMHQLYALEVTPVSTLVQSVINTDTIYFMEGMYENNQKSSADPVSFLLMRSLTEALPENRLSRLLHKHKFAEAESFALQFGLEIELVYKVKVNTILKGLASDGYEDQSAWLKLVLQAKETLNKIKDNSFVVKYCILTPWPTGNAELCSDDGRFVILKKEDASVTHFTNMDPASLLTEVLQTQAKLTTFYGAFGPEKYSGTTWLEFLNNKNIVGYILLQLRGGRLSSAQYLWLRHQKRVAKWLEERARSLELTDKANWPENGLELAQVFFTSKDDSEDKEIHRLMDLVSALQDLVDLYRKYNCRLALCDFEKETTNTIVFRMLDKILAAELIPVALEKYIEPYMCHHRLEKDEILLQYIKNLLLSHCTQSSSIFDTSWEAKAIAVLGCMSDLELIFEGVLAIMHSAVVPWSPSVEDLLLEEGYRLMEMKKLLRSYGIRDTNLLNDKQMILMLAKYILKQDTPSALGDALKIIKAYMLPTAEVYVWKIAGLIDKEKKMHLQLKRALVEILKFLLSLQKENHLQKEEREKDLETFRILVTLQVRLRRALRSAFRSKIFAIPHGRLSSLKTTSEPTKRQGDAEIAGGGETKPGDPGTNKELTPMRLYRLGFLLQKSEAEMGAELAFRALDDGKAGRLLFLVSQKLCHMLGSNIPMVLPEGQDLPDTIYCMACQAATLCSPDLFLDILEFCKYTSFACEIYAKCQMEDFGFIPQATCLDTSKGPYGDWTFEDFFTEDGAVLDTPAVLPFVYKIASSLVPLAEWKSSPLESASLPYCPFEQASQPFIYLFFRCRKKPLPFVQEYDLRPASEPPGRQPVFNSHHVDHQLAFGYCTLLPRAVIFGKLWDIVNQTSQNYKKILAVAIVGTQLAVHYEAPQEKQAFGDLVMDAEWGIELRKFGVSLFAEIFRTPSVRKKELLRTLVQHPKADTSLILKFCSPRGKKNDPFILRVEDENFKPDSDNQEKSGMITCGTFPDLLIQKSWHFTKYANMLLKHLKSYKRSSPPGDLEQQFLFDQGLRLSPAAQSRLPFHLIFFKTSQCFWKIISAEINQESFPKLLLICKVMKVSLDNLHVSALNHIFRELKPKLVAATASDRLWPVDKRTEETMQAVQSYLLSNTKPEWAAALVQTLKICLGLAEKWLKDPTITDESREKAQVHLKRLQGQHKKAATEAILVAQKLNSEDHRKLLSKPTSLILLLYQHSSIAERIQNPTGRDYPDIHAAAREIAQINNLELKKIWDTLLERWLCPNVLLTGPIGINQLTFAHRSRALRCLLFLAEPAVHYLRKVLVEISGIYSLWPISNYSRAWQSVILAPILSALGPPNLDQLEACCGSFKVLLMCPVLADLDLTGIAKRFAQLDLMGLALGCLVLIPQWEKKAQQIQAFLSSSDLEQVLQQTEEHLSMGEAAGVASQVRSSILEHILHQAKEDLAAVKYFPLLRLKERHPVQVKGLVEKLVAKNRMEDAASLITEHLQKPETSLPSKRTASEVVKMYLSELAPTLL